MKKLPDNHPLRKKISSKQRSAEERVAEIERRKEEVSTSKQKRAKKR